MAEWLAKFDRLAPRERLLLVAVAVLVVFLLVDTYLLLPLRQVQDQRNKQLQGLEQQYTQLQAELQVLNRVSGSDPDKTRKQQVAALQGQIVRLDESLSQLSVGLIPAQALPAVLQDVLRKSEHLTLNSVSTLPQVELTLQGQEVSADSLLPAPGLESAGVFKHAVDIHLSGNFFAVRDYLDALEELPWRLYWDSLAYRVTEYPRADVQLRVYTLSTEQGVFVD